MHRLRRRSLRVWEPAGHSLGGALCQVFAAALSQKHPALAKRVEAIYTFGMPRVGDAQFGQNMAQQFPDKCFRITHAADIIPLVSPRRLLLPSAAEQRRFVFALK